MKWRLEIDATDAAGRIFQLRQDLATPTSLLASRASELRTSTFHGWLSDNNERSMQVRCHLYAWAGQWSAEVTIANSSIERPIGYAEFGPIVVRLLLDQTVVATQTIVKGRFYDSTGYRLRLGAPLPYNPCPAVANVIPLPKPESVDAILAAVALFKSPNPIPVTQFEVNGVDRAYDPAPYSEQTGSPRGVGVIPEVVALQLGRLRPADSAIMAGAERALESLAGFVREQARRPYHFWTDAGVPYTNREFPGAIIGMAGIASLYSHTNQFGRDNPNLPKPPHGKGNIYLACDSHHLEVDRLAWAFLLTGSLSALDDFFLIAEAQRAYPMYGASGAFVSNPRPWGWGVRCMAWAYFLRQLLPTNYMPQWAGYDTMIANLMQSFTINVTVSPAFSLFKAWPDRRHIYPFPSQFEVVAQHYANWTAPPKTDPGYVALLDKLDNLIAHPDPKPDRQQQLVDNAQFDITDWMAGRLAAERGDGFRLEVMRQFEFVPVDQVAICVCALWLARRLVQQDMALWARMRDAYITFITYLLQRGTNYAPGGTFWNDVGVWNPLSTAGSGTTGTQMWKAGALALAASEKIFSDPQRSMMRARAALVLAGNKYHVPTEDGYYQWCYGYEFAET